MATNHYSLPTIVGTDTIDGVNAINGLANAVDTALYGVAGQIPQDYVLPIATASALGGVRGGGDIAVNNASGDMSIAAGVVDNSKLAANAIGSGNIQPAAVTASKLSADVSSQLSAGYQASQTLAAQPVRHSMSTTTGQLFGTYVVGAASHMVTMKISAQGARFELTNTNTSSENPILQFDPIPVAYRPTTTFAQLMAVQNLTGAGHYSVYGFIRPDGVAGIYYTNWSAGTASNQQVFADCQLTWFYDVAVSE